MADRIELTVPECEAAITVLLPFVAGNAGRALRTVLDAINGVRDGDPVGTVKRNPATGSIAVRTHQGGERYWHEWKPTPLRASGALPAVNADDWTTLHTPPAPEAPYRDELCDNGECSCAEPKREPRVFDRCLGDTERDAQWIDRQGDTWRWYVPGAGMAVWQYRAPTGSQWIDIFRNPDSQYAPFTEVLQP